MTQKHILLIIFFGVSCTAYVMTARFAGGQEQEEDVWGNTFKGVAISAKVDKAQYSLGEKITVSFKTKNFGTENSRFVGTSGGFGYFRLALYRSDGKPVPKSQAYQKAQVRRRLKQVSIRGSTYCPGNIYSGTVSLNEWYNIREEGTYFLIVIERKYVSWDKDFLISNAVKFEVTPGNGKEESHSPPSKGDSSAQGDKEKDEQVWGHPLREVAISAMPEKTEYAFREKIKVSVKAKNVGKEEAELTSKEGFFGTYRLAMFDSEGRPLPKTEEAEKAEAAWDEKQKDSEENQTTKLKPGQTKEDYVYPGKWFKIEKPGTYYLIVMCRTWTWPDRCRCVTNLFPISNLVKLKITKPEDKKDSSDTPGKEKKEDSKKK